MFTGIIQTIGRIESLQHKNSDIRVGIEIGKLSIDEIAQGDSVAVSGVCLTVVEKTGHGFIADVSGETLSCTVAGEWKVGSTVNLELALTPETRLGGHLVSGHVDGVGEVVKRWSDGRSERFVIRAPASLARYIAAKGSICVDGISLTVNVVNGADFELNIIPHTLLETTMGDFKPGRKVNLEVDIIARYLERLLLVDDISENEDKQKHRSLAQGVTEALLKRHGYLK